MSESADLVSNLYQHLLKRPPKKQEMAYWSDILDKGETFASVFKKFVRSPEYSVRNQVRLSHPPGHFYSPIVNIEEAADYWKYSSSRETSDLIGLAIDLDAMVQFWERNADLIARAPFKFEAESGSRYFYNAGHYPNVDAVILMSMMATYRPRSVIEIGSGLSSAAMLDIADVVGLPKLKLTCIDPDATRLRSVLWPQDGRRVSILEQTVQTVRLEEFAKLDAGDILFIDSSHVLKTGSDVHFELFSILPVLKPGVLVHFHDMHFPFEYPHDWVFEKLWCWNEVYAVRAFLMYNERFQIRFWTDYFIKERRKLVATILPEHKFLVGGSLWLEVRGA